MRTGYLHVSARRLWLAIVAVLGACAEPALYDNVVSIAPESTARHVVLVLRSPSTLWGLTVFGCGSERSLWTIGDGGSAQLPPSRIVYGETPREFAEVVPAQPLTPGCYQVDVSGQHAARFTVNPDGSVQEDAAPGRSRPANRPS